MSQEQCRRATVRQTISVMKVFLSALIVMLCFEALRQALFPNITLWASHVVTMLFSAATATLIAYFLRKALDRRLQNELQQERISHECARAALHESSKSLQALLNAIQESAFLMDSNGKILEANNTLAIRFGTTHHELIGRSAFDLLSPEVGRQRKSLLEQVIRTGKPVHFEDCRNERYIDNAIYPVFAPQGHVTKVAVLGVDITLRKHAEDAFKESERLFRKTLEAVELLGVALDTQGRITFCNDFLLRISGWKREELLHQSWFDLFIPPEIRQSLRLSVFQNTIANENFPSHYTNEILTRDGERRLIAWNNTVQRDTAEHIVGVVCIGEDITERRQNEKALQQWASFAQQHPAPVLRIDNEGTIILANPAAYDILEIQELIGMSVLKIFFPQLSHKLLTESVQTNAVSYFESRIGDKHYHFVLQGVRELGIGHLYGTDISERKQAEQALQHTKELAEQAIRTKGRFLAGMSHELRSPLNVILGSAQNLMRDRQLDSQQQRTLTTIFHSGQCLLEMINEILDMAKVEAGTLTLHPISFHVGEFFATLVEIARFQAAQKGLKFSYIQDPRLPDFLIADKQRLRQILLNLLNNAVKFSAQGQVTFIVHVNATAGQQLTLGFQVQDTGIGIPPEKHNLIFEPFRQLRSPKDGNDGTGLGLSISQHLLYLMNSELRVQSREGEGSVFSFELELQAGTTTEPETTRSKPAVRNLLRYEGNLRKILLVDDRENNRFVLRELLAPLGFELCDAAGGQEAIHQTLNFHPDLILMDLVMADMDGFETTRKIRQLPEAGDVKIIAVSASVSEETQQQCLERGFDAYLEKPIMLDRLYALLQEHLQLVWRSKKPSDTHTQISEPTGSLSRPSQENLRRLLRLAERGNPQEISDFLETLNTEEPSLKAFVLEFQQLLDQYHIKRIRDKVTEYLGEEDDA